MSRQRHVATFDSATGSGDALAAFLAGREWAAGGALPRSVARLLHPVARLLSRAPTGWLEAGIGRGGWLEAIEADVAGDVRAEAAAERLSASYPERRYPAVLIGAPNGAVVHLAALLGAPWLSQTFLVLVRHGGLDVDEPAAIMDWAANGPGRALLEANPDLVLHQMHDPNNDRLMSRHIAYFRLKQIRLTQVYKRFIVERLRPGGTLITVECEQRWPATRAGERHWFQFGGMGDLSPDEYHAGSERVARYLAQRGAKVRTWQAPAPDEEVPESEWGWRPELLEDVRHLAREHGYRLRRLIFGHPEEPSAAVSECYRRSYASRGLRTDRLLVDSFSLIEPWWTLRTRSIPYWLSFNSHSSADRLEAYLDDIGPLAEIHLLLIQHGQASLGMAPAERWQAIVERARRWGRLVDLEAERFPQDLSTYLGFQEALRQIPSRFPIPAPMPVEHLDAFFADVAHRYPLRWVEEAS